MLMTLSELDVDFYFVWRKTGDQMVIGLKNTLSRRHDQSDKAGFEVFDLRKNLVVKST